MCVSFVVVDPISSHVLCVLSQLSKALVLVETLTAQLTSRDGELAATHASLKEVVERLQHSDSKRKHLQFKYDRLVSALRRYDNVSAGSSDDNMSIHKEAMMHSSVTASSAQSSASIASQELATAFAVSDGYPGTFLTAYREREGFQESHDSSSKRVQSYQSFRTSATSGATVLGDAKVCRRDS